MKKKLLSLLLAITLIIGTLPISASAANNFSSISAGSKFNSGDTITNDKGKSVEIWINNSQVGTVANGSSYNVPYSVEYSYCITTQNYRYFFSKLYTVTFDKQGHGTDTASTKDVAHDSKITKPTDPTDTGYTFMGWYKEPACKTQWDFSADKVTSDMTLYAKWEKKFIPVTNITGVPTTGTVGMDLTLTGTVVPVDATNKTLTWSTSTAGAAITDGNKLTATSTGTVTVTATVTNGLTSSSNYTQDFEITINRKANTDTPEVPGISQGDNRPNSSSITITTKATQEYFVSTRATAPTDWSSAINGTGSLYKITGLNPATLYYIHTRIKETNDTMASSSLYTAQYTLPTTPSASDVAIDYGAETITYASTLEVYTSTSGGTLIGSGGKIPENIFGKWIYFRVKAAGGAPVSEWKSITMPSRALQPADVSSTDVTKTDETITIKNPVSRQEYSADGGTTWQDSGSFTGLTAETSYNIVTRVKASGADAYNCFASLPSNALAVTTKISSTSAGTPQAPGISDDNRPNSSSITIYTKATQEYLVSTSATAPTDWSSAINGTGNPYPIEGLNPATQYFIHTRIKETETAMASGSVYTAQYTLPVTPSASDVTIDYYEETISYDDTTLGVYTTSRPGGTLIGSGGKIPEASFNGYLYVRVKEAGGAPASEWESITMPSRALQPADVSSTDVTKTDTTITIKNPVARQEYSADGGTTWQDSGSFTGLTAETSYNIVTRVKASGADAYNCFASLPSNALAVTTLKTTTITENTAKLTQTYDSTTPVDLTELFSVTTAGYDGTLKYTVTNSTGTGTVSSNKLTVTKAGTFTVTLDAPATTQYAPASKEVTLTVNKARGEFGLGITLLWTYGDAAKEPVPRSSTNGIDNVTYRYENQSGTPVYSSSTPPTNVGTYNIYATFPATDLYLGGESDAFFTIQPREITVEKGTYKISKPYDGETDAGTASGALAVTNIISADSGVTIKVGTIPAYSSSAVGNSNITVPISIYGDTNSNYKIKDDATTIQVPAEIVYLPTPATPYTLNPTLNSERWANEDVVITPATGYTISETLSGNYTASITLSATQADVKVYLKNASGQMTDVITIGDINIDKVAPTGDITFNTNSVKKAINDITFGLFFKDNIDVVITAADDNSEIKSTEYFKSEDKLTEQEVKESTAWQSYSAFSETAVDTEKFIYYVKITDKADNVLMFGSDGTTFDTTAPSITGVTDGETYYVTKEVTVSDTNLVEEKVTLNGIIATSPITLDGNKTQSYVIEAEDKAGNETTVTVNMKPISEITDGFSTLTADDVKSSYKSEIEVAQEILNNIDLTNATKDEKDEVAAAKKLCEDLLAKIAETDTAIKYVTDGINGYNLATVKSTDEIQIKLYLADLAVLLDGQNLTEDEITALKNVKATGDALVAKIDETNTAIKYVTDGIKGYDINKVTSDDEIQIKLYLADLAVLLDSDNLTDDERTALKNVKATGDALVAKIDETNTAIKYVTDGINGYNLATVKSTDEIQIKLYLADLAVLLDSQNLTDDEITALKNVKATGDALVAKIDETNKAIKYVTDGIKGYDINKVTSDDEIKIYAYLADLAVLLDSKNLTEAERTALENVKATGDALVAKITETNTAIKYVTDGIKGYDINKVTSDDEIQIKLYLADLAVLLDSKNLTEAERTALEKVKTTGDALIAKITEIKTAVKYVTDGIKGYDITKVTSDDEIKIYAYLADLAVLLDSKNLTKDERTALENVKATGDALITKLKRTNTPLKDAPTGTKVEAVGDTTFDPNTVLVVTKTTPSQKDTLSVTGLENGKEIVSLFDISLMVGDKKVQPNGKVKVTLTLTDEQLAAYTDFKIVYIDENGKSTIIPCTVNGNQITFETDHFSGYGIIGTKRSGSNSPKTGDSNNMLPYIMLALASVGGIMLISKKRRTNKT